MLRNAAVALARRLGIREGAGGTLRWNVLQRVDRPRSTVFLLEADTPAGPLRSFYKTAYIPGTDERAAAAELRHRRALEAAVRLVPRVTTALRHEPIRIDEPLAVSPENLTSIYLAVPGRPLGKSVGWAVPGRRRRGLHVYRLLGRGIRLIEGAASAEETGQRTGRPYLEGKLVSALEACDRLATIDKPQVVREAAFALLERVTGTTFPVLVHGDISQSNVLVEGDTVGIIDFSWMPRLPGNDLVHLMVRIEGERPQWSPWTSRVSEVLCLGYGVNPHDVPEHWKLMRLVRLLGLAGNPNASARQRALAASRVADAISRTE